MKSRYLHSQNASHALVPASHADLLFITVSQVLILDHNAIFRLGENVFIRNLPNLQKISLRHCGVKTIHEKAFTGLKILIEVGRNFAVESLQDSALTVTYQVDLSHNNISQLSRNTFQVLPVHCTALHHSTSLHCLMNRVTAG